MSDAHATLESDGFVVLRGVVEESALPPVRELTDAIVEYADQDLSDPFERYYLRHRSDQGVLYDLCQRHPEFQPFSRLPAVLDALEGSLGKDIFLYENSLVYKPPGRDNAVPWHQDFISRPNEPGKFIAWLALDEVTRANGALKAIPGSHKLGYLPWHRVKGETHHDRLNLEGVDLSTARFVEMQAGDVLIFDAKLVHGSEECHSDKPRRAYRVSYQGFERLDPPRGIPIVVRGGRPDALSRRFNAPRVEKAAWRTFLNKVGKRLQRL
jgi:phytanoyl-CoA hydroxylase